VPPPWGDRPISFLREVQPILSAHCVKCHGGLEPAGGLDFSGGLTARYNRAYETMVARGLVARSNVGDDARVTEPLAFGSHRSRLITAIRGSEHADRITLSSEEWLALVTWIDANAPYHDDFIDKRPIQAPYDLAADGELAGALASVHAERCSACHQPAQVSRVDWIDLHEPARSLFLDAPLAKKAGGAGACTPAAYRGRTDPDYCRLLGTVKAAVERAWQRPRRDLEAIRPF
jgi:hypothetical protein